MTGCARLFIAVCVAALAGAMPRTAAAQGAGTIECDSQHGARRHCAVPGIDPESVTMDERLSNTTCIRGENWDADAQGIWVSGGCRARFGYVRRSGGSASRGHASGGGTSAGTIECDSEHGARRHCAVPGIDPESVTMDEKLSRTNCIRGENWDADAQGVWVSGGCRARFGYVRRSSGGHGVSTSGMKSACIQEAARQWSVTEANLEITLVNPQDDGTTELAVQSRRSRGYCLFDARGRFVRLTTP